MRKALLVAAVLLAVCAVVVAAEKLFSEHGYYQTSMEDVARTAEYATGTIYRYFPSKAELFNRTIVRKGKAFFDSVEKMLGNCDGPLEKLQVIVHEKIRFFFENSEFVKLYLSQVGGSSNTITPPEGMQETHENYIKMLTGIFADGMEKGVFVKMDVDMLVMSFTGMTNHLLFISVSEGRSVSEKEVEGFVLEFLTKGLIKKQRRGRETRPHTITA